MATMSEEAASVAAGAALIIQPWTLTETPPYTRPQANSSAVPVTGPGRTAMSARITLREALTTSRVRYASRAPARKLPATPATP